MALSVRERIGTSGSRDQLERLNELAGVMIEAAELLQGTVAATRTDSGEMGTATRAELCGQLVDDLLSHEVLEARGVVRRASELGCDLSVGALVLCVELHTSRPRFVMALIADDCADALVHIVENAAEPDRLRLYAVLPAAGTCIAGSIGAVRRLTSRIAPYGVVGVSSFQADAAELGRGLREAELMLDVIRNSQAPVAEEVGSGTYRLLLRMLASYPDEVHELYGSTVRAIVRYDAQHETELIPTLRAYLAANGNMNATAAAVFAHRHTIASRLDRIRELTGLDPLNYEDRERLGLGLKAHRLLAPQLTDGA
jgi:sugar diacid utilization regulator